MNWGDINDKPGILSLWFINDLTRFDKLAKRHKPLANI